jgi:hypothetical protein
LHSFFIFEKKKIIKNLLPTLLIVLTSFAFSCSKNELNQIQETQKIETVNIKSVCVTDFGVIVPCEELANWQNYNPNDQNSRGPKLKFKGSSCTIQPGNIVGLECKSEPQPNCLNAFACTPCGNCQ